MARTSIHVEPLSVPIESHGSNELLRLVVPTRCHSGPKAIQDRRVDLVLNADEALALVADILSALPIMLVKDRQPVDRLKSIVKILDLEL